MKAILEVNNLTRQFMNNTALNRISFNLSKGQMMFVTGHSGAGKSTLLKLIALLDRPTDGNIIFDNKNISTITKRQIPYFRRDLGLIFQEPMLLKDRSIFHNVALPLLIDGAGYDNLKRKVRAALDKVSMLGKEKKFPQELSAGEQQRVSIARAIVHRPKLLLADEPTGNLDPKLSLETFELFKQLSHVGVSSIITTHDLYLIQGFSQRILQLEGGAIAS